MATIDKPLPNTNITETVVKVPKKRGREPKKKPEGEENVVLVKKPKKRGRKPKGGKIIKTLIEPNKNQKIKPNVILHLKCSLKDIEQKNESISVLKYNPNVENMWHISIPCIMIIYIKVLNLLQLLK